MYVYVCVHTHIYIHVYNSNYINIHCCVSPNRECIDYHGTSVQWSHILPFSYSIDSTYMQV